MILTVGDQPFLLVASGGWAWSRGALQEQAIIAAARNARRNAGRGRATLAAGASPIRYELAGAPTAIDAAAARCASLGAGKIQPTLTR